MALGVILAALLSIVITWAMWTNVVQVQECPLYVQQPTGVEWVCVDGGVL